MTTATTNGSATSTATVETLAAEVRVLQIGNRQVTMSVFKQLDYRPVNQVDIFGRVSTPRKEYDVAGIDVVGRSTTDGTLVRAFVIEPKWNGVAPKSFYHWLFHTADPASAPTYWYAVSAEYGTSRLKWRSSRDSWDCSLPHTLEGCPDYRDLAGSRVTGDEYQLGRWLNAEYQHRRAAGAFCDVVALEKEWLGVAEVQFADLKAKQDQYNNAAAQPLIVLAGLR